MDGRLRLSSIISHSSTLIGLTVLYSVMKLPTAPVWAVHPSMNIRVKGPDRDLGGWDLDLWLHTCGFLIIHLLCACYMSDTAYDSVRHSFAGLRLMKALASLYI